MSTEEPLRRRSLRAAGGVPSAAVLRLPPAPGEEMHRDSERTMISVGDFQKRIMKDRDDRERQERGVARNRELKTADLTNSNRM